MSSGRVCTVQTVVYIVSDIESGGGFFMRDLDCPRQWVFALRSDYHPTAMNVTVSGMRAQEGSLSLGLSTSSENAPPGIALCRSGKEAVEIKTKAYDVRVSGAADVAAMVMEGNLSPSSLPGPLPISLDLDAGRKLDGVPLLNGKAPSWVSRGIHYFRHPQGAFPRTLTLDLSLAGEQATVTIRCNSDRELPRGWLVRIR